MLTNVSLIDGARVLAALPIAAYTADAEGRLTFYNDAAASLWGRKPEIGASRWCGSWRLYRPDGRPLAHEDCPTAVSLKEARPVRGVEVVIERPDGTRVGCLAYPALVRDDSGRTVGTVCLLIEAAERGSAEIELERLAAIVSSCDDAIISKTLDGRVTSWNNGATRIFGYQPEDMIGQSILRIIPPDLHKEEDVILAKLRRGERIDHYETVRVAKDGRRLDISLTVSPLRDRAGNVVGAAKVARDVSERKRSEEMQRLLLEELNHRVKNTLATIQAIASQSLRWSASPSDFVTSFTGRVQALARAHDLLVEGRLKGAEIASLVREQVVFGAADGGRVSLSGPQVVLEPRSAVQLALVLHELATNARKYGALSVGNGKLSISWKLRTGPERQLMLDWKESGVSNLSAPTGRGFGTTLIERSLEASGGEAAIRYHADGLACAIRLPLPELEERTGAGLPPNTLHEASTAQATLSAPELTGKRILVVEDEPFLAMDIEAQLEAAGCLVVGPAATVDKAKRLISGEAFDAAVVDANLCGRPVDELAAALTQKGIPFVFATGYGREGLPHSFHDVPMVAKPFRADELLAVLRSILSGEEPERQVLAFRSRQR